MQNPKPESQKPLARTEGLVYTRLKDELVIYDMERHKAHSLNHIARLVWEHCDGQTSVQQLSEMLARALPERVDEQIVWLALRQFERNQLLTERVGMPSNVISRREAARIFGKASAILLPLIISTVVKAESCPSGFTVCGTNCCAPNQTCSSGVCVP